MPALDEAEDQRLPNASPPPPAAPPAMLPSFVFVVFLLAAVLKEGEEEMEGREDGDGDG